MNMVPLQSAEWLALAGAVGVWVSLYLLDRSPRGRQWLIKTTGLSVPLALVGIWWMADQAVWPSSWLSQPGQGLVWLGVLAVTMACLATAWLRLPWTGQLQQRLSVNWWGYGLSVAGMTVMAALAKTIGLWPSLVGVAVLMAMAIVISSFVWGRLAAMAVVAGASVILLYLLSSGLAWLWPELTVVSYGLPQAFDAVSVIEMSLLAAALGPIHWWWLGQKVQVS